MRLAAARFGHVRFMTSSPSDNTTLTTVLASWESSGFDASFSPRDASMVECLTCGTTQPAGQFSMTSLRRLGGASAPDDMMAAVAITCRTCSAQGVLVPGYGPMASAQDSDILVASNDSRRENALAPHASPSDTPQATAKSAQMGWAASGG